MKTKAYSISKDTETLSVFLKALITITLFILIGVSAWSITPTFYPEPTDSATIKGTVTDAQTGETIPFVNILVTGTKTGTQTDFDGKYELKVPIGEYRLAFSFIGYETKEETVIVKENEVLQLDAQLNEAIMLSESIMVRSPKSSLMSRARGLKFKKRKNENYVDHRPLKNQTSQKDEGEKSNRDNHQVINENDFKGVKDDPLSTFSIDVDNAGYTLIRSYINQNTKPEPKSIRIEEMINYFDYNYPQPQDEHPLNIHLETADCPWNQNHQLALVAIQGEKKTKEEIPRSNFVFLIDVSGSMSDPNKLGLLKKSFITLLNELNPTDKVAIVVYAGAAGLVLPSTNASERETILNAINKLQAGGSTAGGAGIKLAYDIAKMNFIKGGNNRVILATDGDFNVGASSDAAMVSLIEEKRKLGIYLTILGFGMGNYQDGKMEQISNAGNGNYFYVDNLNEAKKALGREVFSTMYTIAKDVKFQIEFNPNEVRAYRLIGYVNRLLADQDFNDDTKDAGELGAGHQVTAIYELVPTSSKSKILRKSKVDKLKYQSDTDLTQAAQSGDLMTVKLRYKKPNASKSIKIEKTLINRKQSLENTSESFRFASSVAAFGMILNKSKHAGKTNYDMVLNLAQKSKGSDPFGYRTEFIDLVKKSKKLK